MHSTPLQPDPGAPDPESLDPGELLTHVDWLRRLARALVRDDAAADDLVQDAMGVAVAAKAPIRDVRAFLAGTVRRLASRARRGETRRARRESEVAHSADAALPAADELAERVDTLRIVLEELRELPPAQQRAVSLRYLEDLDAGEIARREGSTPSTVRSHLTRGLSALRERLDRRAGGRDAWCAVLAPFAGLGAPIAPTPGGEIPVPDPVTSAATSVKGVATAVGASGVLAMTLKTVSLALVPIALAGAWFAAGDRGKEIDATIARPDAPIVEPAADLADIATAAEASRASVVEPPAADDPVVSADEAETGEVYVEGRVVDAATGEPVPFLDLIVVPVEPGADGTRPSISVTSDEVGDFSEAFQTLPAGPVEVTVLDSHGGIMSAPEKLTLDLPFEEALEVKVGPTFRFDLPEDVELDEDHFMVVYELDGTRFENRPIDATVRRGDMPWARFSPRAMDIEGDGPWTLEFRGMGGLYLGRAEVHRKAGVEPVPVRFDMEARGVVEFVLRTKDTGQIANAKVDVRPLEGDEDDVERIFLGHHDTEGNMRGRLRHAEPGRYVWSFGPGAAAVTGEVEVLAGEVTTVELDSAELGATFDTYVLVDATGAPDLPREDWMCMVVSADDATTGFITAPTRNDADPEGFLRIEMNALVDGRWTVGMDAGPRYDVEPGTLTVGPGDPIVTVKVVPAPKRVPVTIRAVDDETGEPIPEAEAFFQASATDGSSFSIGDGFVLGPEELPAETESQIVVRAFGYRMKGIRHLPSRDGGEIEARLERGWASRVAVIEPSTFEMIEGVEVHVDGESVGRTDVHGEVWIEGDGPPDLIEVGKGDASFQVVRSPFDERDESMADPLMGYVFVVVRR